MQSASDWLFLLGFLFLFVGTLAALYIYLPWLGGHRPQVAETKAAPRRSLAEWSELADRHEGYGPGHARRVAMLARLLAEAIALPGPLLAPLEQACLLHDVGEIDFEGFLLARPGPLGQAELFKIWQHGARGARLAREITGSDAVGQWVRWHHERWDGLGYPDGLVGTAIPLPARILRLADSAEAMLHQRPYRGALAGDDVLAEINRLSGISYDPELARVFVDYVLPRYLAEQGSERPGSPVLPT